MPGLLSAQDFWDFSRPFRVQARASSLGGRFPVPEPSLIGLQIGVAMTKLFELARALHVLGLGRYCLNSYLAMLLYRGRA